jgi:glutathionyl-hydroquinone reductase
VGSLIDGKWTDNDESYRQAGAFMQPTPAFRSLITADGSSQFPARPNSRLFRRGATRGR